jgi:hypothetical protein
MSKENAYDNPWIWVIIVVMFSFMTIQHLYDELKLERKEREYLQEISESLTEINDNLNLLNSILEEK